MSLPFPPIPALILLSAVLGLLLPVPMVLAFGLILALGFAIDMAALRRQAAPALLQLHER